MSHKILWTLFGISIATLLSIITIYIFHNIIILIKPQIIFKGTDKFEIKEIYPTKNGSREWFIYMANPKNDPSFTITDGIPLVKNTNDNSWFINNSIIRMNVITPKGYTPWKNIEMTGYVKVIPIINRTIATKTSSSSKNNGNINNTNSEGSGNIMNIDWRARGGVHNNKDPCKGTAMNGGINIDGVASWKKEIWHTGGYTNERGTVNATRSIADRWIGWKIVIYNIEKDKAVKMESYLDDQDNNDWKKVTDLIDNGEWYAKSKDSVFYSAGCGKPKDYIITNAGPIATFRADNVALNFKYLSIREIQVPN